MPVNKYCKNLRTQLAFSSFKIRNLLSVKDYAPRSFHSSVVYRFKCAGCNSVYTGKKQAEIYLFEYVRIYFLINIQIYLNILKAQLLVKRLAMIAALKCWILETLLIN